MTKRRTNFKAMNLNKFVAYLHNKTIVFAKSDEILGDGTTVTKVIPSHYRLKTRMFNVVTGKQVNQDIISEDSQLSSFIKIVNDNINNMSTKGVYHPRRLQPKWQSLATDEEKLELFRKYMKAPTSSIGFIRLMDVNLPNKTMESIIIDHPQFETLISIDNLRQKCIDKFRLYENGREYLNLKGID